jgi:hypothetical protein
MVLSLLSIPIDGQRQEGTKRNRSCDVFETIIPRDCPVESLWLLRTVKPHRVQRPRGLRCDFFRLSLCSNMLSYPSSAMNALQIPLSAACRSNRPGSRRFRCLRGLGRALRPTMAPLRRIHLPAVIWAAIVELFGWVCPLTPLENWLEAEEDKLFIPRFHWHYILLLYPEELTREVQITWEFCPGNKCSNLHLGLRRRRRR